MASAACLSPPGADARGRDYQDLRWSRFKNFAPAEMYTVVGEHVFPFMRSGACQEGCRLTHAASGCLFDASA